MEGYQKPIVRLNEETAEGVYAASGDSGKDRCRFGRKFFKENASDCKKCIASGGTSVSNEPGQVPGHVVITPEQCPDKMPPR